jgi:1,4-dihydroxy-2-naphthoate octaprenyltransferase
MYNTLIKVRSWLELSRIPFHSVGILPFLLGTLLAWKLKGQFSCQIFGLALLAIVLIMLSTYHAGEYFDFQEDKISKHHFNSKFAGGSGITQAGKLPREVPLTTSIIAFLMAGIIGLILQFYYKTGNYTLLLGCTGALAGFFYSTPPIRLVEKGFGELFIWFCYGWLPIAIAFYIQTGYIEFFIFWISLPVGITIFNVIFLNEFLDYEADVATGKKNLLVRLGKKRGALLYNTLTVTSWLIMFLTVIFLVPLKALYLYIPIVILSSFIIIMMSKKKYEDMKILAILAGLNIVVNLGTTASYILAFI